MDLTILLKKKKKKKKASSEVSEMTEIGPQTDRLKPRKKFEL